MSVAHDLEPDDFTMHRFLEHWFAGCNQGALELGWTDARTGKLSLFRRFELDDIAAATRFAAETNARSGCSVYFRAATVRPDSHFTRDGDVVQIPGCWTDCDTVTAIERVLAAINAMPTTQIITGRIPTLRSQFLWKFSGPPILLPEPSRELNKRACALADGDPAVTNPSSLMRLPGSIAWPWKPGREAELTEWITPDGGGNTIALDTLRFRLPTVAPAQVNGTSVIHPALNPIQDLIDQVRAGPLWHDPVLRLVAILVGRGTPNAAILAMAEHLTWAKYSVAQTRDELAKMIDGARRKGFHPDVVADVMDVPSGTTPFPLLTTRQAIDMPPPSWLVPGLLTTNSFGCLYGPPESLKSFLALDLCLRLAHGLTWLDKPLGRRDVILIAGEGAAALGKRIEAWCRHTGLDVPNGFRLLPQAVNLLEKGDADRLVETARGAAQNGGLRPALVVVDTLARAMVGGDENSAQDMGLLLAAGVRIQAALKCALLAVHHTGKDSERGMRGSSALFGAADTVLKVTRSDDRLAVLVEKQKDDEGGQTYRLRTSKLELPPRGGIAGRSSLVLLPDDDGDPPSEVTDRRQHIRPSIRLFHDALIDALCLPRDGPPGETTKALWEAECVRRDLLDPIEPNDTTSVRGRKRGMFRTAKSILLAAGLIGISGDRVTDLSKPR